MKKTERFKIWFRRKAEDAKEIGPVDVFDVLESTSIRAARIAAKEIAKQNGWRFMEAWAEEESAQISAQSPITSSDVQIAVDR